MPALLVGLAVLLAACGGGGSGGQENPGSGSQAVADFYEGKTIRWLVGFDPGGSMDVYSRLIADKFGDNLPGSPRVVVENLPGGGGAVATSQAFNALPQDGTIIVGTTGGLASQQLVDPAQFDFDFAAFQHLGTPAPFGYVLWISRSAADRLGVQRFEDVIGPGGKEIAQGALGVGYDYTAQLLLRDVLGAKVKTVTGYGGSSAAKLATQTGEIDGFPASWDTLTGALGFPLDDVVVLARLTGDDDAGDLVPAPIADAPTWLSFAENDEERRLLTYGLVQPQQFGRSFGVAPGVPPDRLEALRAAFLAALQDPEVQEEAQRAGLPVDPIPGADLQRTFDEYMAMPPDVLAALKPVLQP